MESYLGVQEQFTSDYTTDKNDKALSQQLLNTTSPTTCICAYANGYISVDIPCICLIL